MTQDITITFPNDVTAAEFLVWLSESGEQDMWEWFEYRQQEGKDVRNIDFRYVDDYTAIAREID